MSIEVYGIPNCDTVKKARNWLDAKGLAYTFHDYKKEGAGTTFKKLPDSDKIGLDEAKAIALMLASPSMIKRPVVEHPGGLLVGFKPEQWEAVLG